MLKQWPIHGQNKLEAISKTSGKKYNEQHCKDQLFEQPDL